MNSKQVDRELENLLIDIKHDKYTSNDAVKAIKRLLLPQNKGWKSFKNVQPLPGTYIIVYNRKNGVIADVTYSLGMEETIDDEYGSVVWMQKPLQYFPPTIDGKHVKRDLGI